VAKKNKQRKQGQPKAGNAGNVSGSEPQSNSEKPSKTSQQCHANKVYVRDPTKQR
jgi:hypothetical protein